MEEKELIDKINELQDSNAKLSRRLNEIETSVTWKSTKPFRIVLDSFRKLGIKIVRIGKQIGKLGYLVIYTTQKFGIKVTIDKILHESKRNIETAKTNIETQEIADGDEVWEELSKWIDSTPHSFIDIFSVPMGWNTPLFQRFQHISLQAGNAGGISIYGAHPSIDQDVRIYKLVSPTLCIVNLDDYMIKKKLFQLLDTKTGLKYILIQSFDLATTMDENGAIDDAWHRMPAPSTPRWWEIAEEPVSRVSAPITQWECPYIYLFGGLSNDLTLRQTLWRGTINRLTFKPIY